MVISSFVFMFFSIHSKTWCDLFIPRSNKVLNIIAELKPPHRSEIVAMLTAYGFRCMKYVEAYDLVISSDSHLKFEFGRLLMESDFSDHIRGMGYYGIGCHEMHPTSTHLNTTEVIQNRDLFHPRFCIFKLNSWLRLLDFLTHVSATGPLVRSQWCCRLLLGWRELRRAVCVTPFAASYKAESHFVCFLLCFEWTSHHSRDEKLACQVACLFAFAQFILLLRTCRNVYDVHLPVCSTPSPARSVLPVCVRFSYRGLLQRSPTLTHCSHYSCSL